MTLSRRGFLRGASGALGFFGAAAAMNKVLGSEVFAATLNGYAGYRALVTVFLLGGNDGNNLLVPMEEKADETGQYDHYAKWRRTVALTKAELLAINPTGLAAGSYGVHGGMPKLKALFEAGKAAFVCNVGPLVVPMRLSDYLDSPEQRPDNLLSHSDQQDAWASAIANPLSVVLPADLAAVGPTGWGGRVADRIDTISGHGGDGLYPEGVFLSGKSLFGTGKTRKALTVGTAGVFGLKVTGDAAFNEWRELAFNEVLGYTNDVTMEESYGETLDDAMLYSEQRSLARDNAWGMLPVATRDAINTAFLLSPLLADGTPAPAGTAAAASDGSLKAQLYQVVRDIIAGATAKAADGTAGLGLRRQMFSVSVGSFDTHSGQKTAQGSLLAQLDVAMAAFQEAMEELAGSGGFGTTPPQATLFTMSDFARTLLNNADDGSDHAWGNHMIVVGSNVVGKKLYGAYPNLDLEIDPVTKRPKSPDTTDDHGRWIPTLCVEQMANTLAVWLGASNATSDRPYLFPNLAGFLAAATAGGFPAHTKLANLGFMTA